MQTLGSTFGFASFRPLQEEIVQTILRGQDVFALMPTGGGKSLCYQLPALLLDGTTVVVSPLIALMKDQVDALRALGVSATFINSSLDPDEIDYRVRLVARGEVKLLYVAPERLMLPNFLPVLGATPIALFAIDEAHCISEWGHDFRPEYRQLRRLRELFPGVPLGAFTATATARVQTDIATQLGLQGAATFQGSFNRPNLFYEVRPKRNAYAQLVDYLRAHPQSSGIIYCGSRSGTEDLATQLSADGFPAQAYHAGLTAEQRRSRQEAFIRDDVPIIVATIAFGMGIDKPDVRFVIHMDLPKTLENYYQESGRAGRDGEPSDCILFYSAGDAARLRYFAEQRETDQERRVALWQLRQMTDWAESPTCRRRALLAYFDESFEGQEPPCCDVCMSPSTEEDLTVPAQMFLSCVKRTGERFGMAHIIDVLRGSRNERVLRFGHDRLSTYGIGHDRSQDQWRELVRELIRGGYLHQDPDKYNTLTVTERGQAVLFEGERVAVLIRQRPEAQRSPAEMTPHRDLFERLRAVRKDLADEQGLPPYAIFYDRALRQMAAQLPATRAALLRLPGVGERKAAVFGERFLQVIRAYAEETGATPEVFREPDPAPKRTKAGFGNTARHTLSLLRDGLTPEEIATARNLALKTIEGHIADAIEAGEGVRLDDLVDPAKQEKIRAAMEANGSEFLAPVKELLGPKYSYGELKFVRAAMNRAKATREQT